MADLALYDMLGTDLAEKLRGQAQRIRERVSTHTKAMLETGRDLQAAKEHLEHGEFALWVEAECGINVRMAQMYMRAAEWFDRECEYTKPVSLMDATAVIELSKKSTPEHVRQSVADSLKEGTKVTTKSIRFMLSEAREDRRKEAEEAKLEARTPAAKAAEKRRREKQKQEQAAADKRYREQQDRGWEIAVEAANILRGRLTSDEWERVCEILREPYVRLLDAMHRSDFNDPEAEGYLPPAFRAYDQIATARLVDENARLNATLNEYDADAKARLARLESDTSDDFEPSRDVPAFMWKERAA